MLSSSPIFVTRVFGYRRQAARLESDNKYQGQQSTSPIAQKYEGLAFLFTVHLSICPRISQSDVSRVLLLELQTRTVAKPSCSVLSAQGSIVCCVQWEPRTRALGLNGSGLCNLDQLSKLSGPVSPSLKWAENVLIYHYVVESKLHKLWFEAECICGKLFFPACFPSLSL